MKQTLLIILTALAMGVFGAIATWVFIDLSGGVGGFLAKRKARKKLEAEAKALQEAEAEKEDED